MKCVVVVDWGFCRWASLDTCPSTHCIVFEIKTLCKEAQFLLLFSYSVQFHLFVPSSATGLAGCVYS